jgi:putative ABC transport system permease protein
MKKLKSFLSGLGMLLIILISVVLWVMLPWQVLLALLILLLLWMAFTQTGRQAASVTWVGVSTLGQRLGSSSVIMVGIAGVVGVLVAMLAMGDGLQKTLKSTGDTETAIVLRGGASAELSSGISREHATLISQAAGILRDAEGKPITSAELVVVANLPKKSTGTDANVEIRGVGPQVWALRPNVQIIEGRKFTPGLREMIVGKGARQQFAGLDPGSTINLNNQQWTIVGVFASGDAHESELEGDVDTVSAAYRRQGYQSVTVRLTSPEALDTFKATLASDPQLKVEAKTTLEYYTAQSEGLSKVIRVVGITIATIMAIGAIFGALNSMYAAVATRAREIATGDRFGDAGNDAAGPDRRSARRFRCLVAVQQLHGLDAGCEFQPGRVPVFGFAGPALDRREMGPRHRLRRRPAACRARSTAAGDDGTQGVLEAGNGEWGMGKCFPFPHTLLAPCKLRFGQQAAAKRLYRFPTPHSPFPIPVSSPSPA